MVTNSVTLPWLASMRQGTFRFLTIIYEKFRTMCIIGCKNIPGWGNIQSMKEYSGICKIAFYQSDSIDIYVIDFWRKRLTYRAFLLPIQRQPSYFRTPSGLLAVPKVSFGTPKHPLKYQLHQKRHLVPQSALWGTVFRGCLKSSVTTMFGWLRLGIWSAAFWHRRIFRPWHSDQSMECPGEIHQIIMIHQAALWILH